MALTSSGLAVALAAFVHSFADLFSGFGADLPVLTTFYIELRPYAPYASLVFWVPAIVLLAKRDVRQARRLVNFAGTGTVVFLVLLLLAFLAFYLPILKLGPVV